MSRAKKSAGGATVFAFGVVMTILFSSATDAWILVVALTVAGVCFCLSAYWLNLFNAPYPIGRILKGVIYIALIAAAMCFIGFKKWPQPIRAYLTFHPELS